MHNAVITIQPKMLISIEELLKIRIKNRQYYYCDKKFLTNYFSTFQAIHSDLRFYICNGNLCLCSDNDCAITFFPLPTITLIELTEHNDIVIKSSYHETTAYITTSKKRAKKYLTFIYKSSFYTLLFHKNTKIRHTAAIERAKYERALIFFERHECPTNKVRRTHS